MIDVSYHDTYMFKSLLDDARLILRIFLSKYRVIPYYSDCAWFHENLKSTNIFIYGDKHLLGLVLTHTLTLPNTS